MRPGTNNWVGDGGMLAFTHGWTQKWCDVCCLEAQLAHAYERAAEIPGMLAKLADLRAAPRVTETESPKSPVPPPKGPR